MTLKNLSSTTSTNDTEMYLLYKNILLELKRLLHTDNVRDNYLHQDINGEIYCIISDGKIALYANSENIAFTYVLFAYSFNSPNYVSEKYRVEYDSYVYFDSDNSTNEYMINHETNNIIQLIKENELSSDELESLLFQHNTLYSDEDKFCIWMDYYIRDYIEDKHYFCVNYNRLNEFSADIYENILLELKKYD